MNTSLIALALLVFIAVMLLVVGAESIWLNLWGDNVSQIKQRLQVISGELNVDSKSFIKARLFSQFKHINHLISQIPHIDAVDTFLTQAGLKINLGGFLFRIALLTMVSLLCAVTLQLPFWLELIVMVSPSLLWVLYLQRKRRQRVIFMEEQLPDTLDLMARAMQAGHAFSSALLIVGAEGSQPIKNEFQTTFDEINFGISTEIALHNLTKRVASSDLRFFAVAVLIQLETGGNLTEILKSLASLIRDRQRIAGTVRVLTAEGRLSAWILGLLPFVLAGILSVVNHQFISKLWTEPLGIQMLEVSLCLMAIGIWWMWRMVRVEI